MRRGVIGKSPDLEEGRICFSNRYCRTEEMHHSGADIGGKAAS